MGLVEVTVRLPADVDPDLSSQLCERYQPVEAVVMIGYPATNVDLRRGHTAVRALLLALVSLTVSVLVGSAPASISHRRQRRHAAEAPRPRK